MEFENSHMGLNSYLSWYVQIHHWRVCKFYVKHASYVNLDVEIGVINKQAHYVEIGVTNKHVRRRLGKYL